MRPDRRRFLPPSQCPPTLPEAEVGLIRLQQFLATAATPAHMMSINERTAMKSVGPKISLVHKLTARYNTTNSEKVKSDKARRQYYI